MTDQPLSVTDLPDRVLRHIAALLDTSAVRNWRTLVSLIPEYTVMDVRGFTREEQLGKSASMALLHDLHSRGWTVARFASLARQAKLVVIVDLLKEYCQEAGIKVAFCEDPEPSAEWKPAKSCFDRPHHPPSPPPPLSPPPSTQHSLSTSPSLPPPSSQSSQPPPSPPSFSSPPSLPSLSSLSSSPPPSTSLPSTSPPSTHPPSTSLPSTSPPSIHPQAPAEVAYSSLRKGTNSFSPLPYKEGGHKLGEGGFGEVFYCQAVVHGSVVEAAVKVLNSMEGSRSCSIDKRQFLTELRALSLLSHECLLPVLGYSCDGPHLCLLYPFMPHGSLDAHLSSPLSLSPQSRLQVAWDVARALEYLHTGTTQVCVHRDVKSANILLTETWRGRLGDFGVVRFLPSPLTTHTTTVVGTLVYMAPEYSKGGLISPAADVFSFGVVLYELLTGMSALGDIDGDGTDLISYIEAYEGEVSDILIGQWPEEVGQEVWSLAEQCIEENRAARPTAAQLCHKLQSLCNAAA